MVDELRSAMHKNKQITYCLFFNYEAKSGGHRLGGNTGRHTGGTSPGFMVTHMDNEKNGQTIFGLTISFGPWSPAHGSGIGPVGPIFCRLFFARVQFIFISDS
jgi:hypothetical protein